MTSKVTIHIHGVASLTYEKLEDHDYITAYCDKHGYIRVQSVMFKNDADVEKKGKAEYDVVQIAGPIVPTPGTYVAYKD